MAGAFVALAIFAAAAQAQSFIVQIANPKADSIPPAPNISVFAVGAPPAGAPYNIRLLIARDAAFRQPIFPDKVLTGVESGTFTVDSLLTEHTVVHIRAQLTDRAGAIVADTALARPIQGWVQLLNPPPEQSLTNLSDRRVEFRWASPPITFLWEYDLTVIEKRTGDPAFRAEKITSTSQTFDVEASTAYTWQVTARKLGSSGSTEVTVKSPGSFIISTSDQPLATVAYQNFPNPFGRGISPTTCFWFDIGSLTQVRLMIYSLNLHRVRNLIPGAAGTSSFLPGLYGRSASNPKGCDMSYSWDGRDDNGRFVPAGIYIAEFRANGKTTTKKIYFKGP
jgi:hypothetical protein